MRWTRKSPAGYAWRAALPLGLMLSAPRVLASQGTAQGVLPDKSELRPASLPLHVAPASVAGSSARRTLWFALGGAVAGAAVCTVISNAIDEHDGFATCSTKGYAMFVAGGAAAGALVAVLTGGD